MSLASGIARTLSRSSLAIAFVAVALISCRPDDHSAARLNARIDREIARLELALKKLETSKLPKEVTAGLPQERDALAKARAAAPPDLRLYRLREPAIQIGLLEFMDAHQDSVRSLETFQTLWTRERAAFLRTPAFNRGTILERGLSQAGANRAQKLFTASAPYAKSASAFEGLYYLSEGDGNRRFGLFVDSLITDDAAEKGTPAAAALQVALVNLQEETLQAFERDPGSGMANGISARLKETRELIDRNWIEGATLGLLESRLSLSRREASPGFPQPPAAPPSTVRVREDSVRHLWETRAGHEPGQRSQLIKRDVLPLYASLFAPIAAQRAAAAPVTVTLVRWPYT